MASRHGESPGKMGGRTGTNNTGSGPGGRNPGANTRGGSNSNKKSKPKVSGNPYNKPAPPKYAGPLQDLNNMAFDALNKFPAKPGTPDGRTDEGDIAKSVVNGKVSYRQRMEGMDYNNPNMNPVAFGNNTDLAREFGRRGGPNTGGGGATRGPIMDKIGKVGGFITDKVFGLGGAAVGNAVAGPIGGYVMGKLASKASKNMRGPGKGPAPRSSGPGGAGEHSAYKKQNFAQTNRMMDYDDDILGIDGPIKQKKKDSKPKNKQRYSPTRIF